MNRYSLHIGLNRVNPSCYGGWDGKLKGCHNDAEAMYGIAIALGTRCNVMFDGEATMNRVIDAIYLLSKDAVAGDSVLITYSGHGGQVPDNSGEEKDGFDETWCLYDGMLIDDDINVMLAAFRKGVRVVVVSDSCHSGTVIKNIVMGVETLSVPKRLKVAPASACRVAPRSSTPIQQSSIKRPRMKASIVLLSGCQDNQYSYDGPQNGLFTGTLLAVYAGGSFKGSYREFRKQISRLMPAEQTPQLYIIGGKNKAFEAGPIFH